MFQTMAFIRDLQVLDRLVDLNFDIYERIYSSDVLPAPIKAAPGTR